MLREQTAVYDPEEISLLAKILDRAVATLPPSMQTPANRIEIAKIILARAASGETALAPLMKFEVAEELLISEPTDPASQLTEAKRTSASVPHAGGSNKALLRMSPSARRSKRAAAPGSASGRR